MYAAKVIADSQGVSSEGESVRIVTLEVTFPRFILAEFNTHRVFSRNSASSRAIPVERRIAQVRDNPFVPEAFGVNRPGMQATAELDDRDGSKARDAWLAAAADAVKRADQLADLGVHKQHANRLLEPFCWHTVVVTSTEWANFMALRPHPAAQPEMQITARAMRAAIEASAPAPLVSGEWHLPYVTPEDLEAERWELIRELAPRGVAPDDYGASVPKRAALRDLRGRLRALSVTRCAAVSYERQYAHRTIAQAVERHDAMRSAGHWSPFEHQAMVATHGVMEHGERVASLVQAWRASPARRWTTLEGYGAGNLRPPFVQYRKLFAGEAVWPGDGR